MLEAAHREGGADGTHSHQAEFDDEGPRRTLSTWNQASPSARRTRRIDLAIVTRRLLWVLRSATEPSGSGTWRISPISVSKRLPPVRIQAPPTAAANAAPAPPTSTRRRDREGGCARSCSEAFAARSSFSHRAWARR